MLRTVSAPRVTPPNAYGSAHGHNVRVQVFSVIRQACEVVGRGKVVVRGGAGSACAGGSVGPRVRARAACLSGEAGAGDGVAYWSARSGYRSFAAGVCPPARRAQVDAPPRRGLPCACASARCSPQPTVPVCAIAFPGSAAARKQRRCRRRRVVCAVQVCRWFMPRVSSPVGR